MTFERLSGVTLATADMARSVAFYEAIGLRARYGGADAELTSFDAGGGGFVNVQLDPAGAPGPDRRVWGRVILWVDDVDAAHERVVAAGYRPEMAPSDAPWGERYFHVRDPDGHEISLARPLA